VVPFKESIEKLFLFLIPLLENTEYIGQNKEKMEQLTGNFPRV
jgi:hypothetical protein